MKLYKLFTWLLIAAMPFYAEDPGGGGGDGDGGDNGGSGDGGGDGGDDGGSSLLSQGGQGQQEGEDEQQQQQQQEHWAPEKYQVKNADGSIDVEATAKKQAEAFRALEARMGTDGVRPKTAEEYTFTVPDELKDQWKPEEDDQYKSFRSEAHKQGFTQSQFEFAIQTYLDSVAEIQTGGEVISQQESQAALRKAWPTEKEYTSSLNASYRAVAAYANPGSTDVLGSMVNLDRKFGEDPDFIALMANIGREIKEDIPPQGSVLSDNTIDELQKSEAYWDENHPQHAEVKAKVNNHYARKFPGKH